MRTAITALMSAAISMILTDMGYPLYTWQFWVILLLANFMAAVGYRG